ncbi:type IV pilus biogenesis/stability protein PilW [Tritonibacter multivorans]|uniref:protein O-GlcNAc transferase n=1 Tax=Tritonibacter multivorans TaxID=928856 RepID=A0A0P1GZF3_9RHOB|nr:tetratricopeptide repeat protein [Tritonibacter multivorans]MDA7420386.1 tetratricopeptide repeat protein [Tritonibacter multivorans]CUH81690.1 type IV pilus biogenesis/stability protein PilW [Tritonibacter multivorans]SFC41608.1 Predicted O-linked N-acetylglucosamine transferase, SPINDLY family [Tritonibacter multivorans]
MTQQNANNILSQRKKQAGANPEFAAFADKVQGQKMAQIAYETKHGLRNHKFADADPKEQAAKLLKECRKLSLRGERKQAMVLLRKAIELDEKNVELHLQMGDMLGDKPETRVEAMKSLMIALRLAPKDSKVYLSLGSLLMQMGREAEAIDYFELAATFNPKNALALSRMMHLKAHRQDWSFWPKVNQYLKPFRGTKLIADPFVFLPLVDDGQFQKERSIALANFSFDNRNTTKLDRPAREPGAKIRIGYFSSDFYDHATMHLMGGIFENHDRDQFEIYVYDYGSAFRDAENQRVRDTVDVFRDVRNVPGETIVSLARRDMLDIAIDLKGHTRGGRLEMFNKRVAPVQIAYLGYPGTTGVRAMDYMIGDEVTIPNRLQKHYCEKILYMPNCYQPTDENRYIAETGKTRADHGLPEDAFVFASFNGAYKVTPAEFDIWMELLKEVENSVLWFYVGERDHSDRLRAEAEKRGVDGSRIIATGRFSPAEHLERMKHADLFLDAFAVNAHTTASESLWAGVPMVTKLGDQFAARVAGSVLTAAGLEELVAKTPQQYKAIALRLATDPDYFAEVKEKLETCPQDSALFDTVGYTRDFEALLEQAHERHMAGKSPRHMRLS